MPRKKRGPRIEVLRNDRRVAVIGNKGPGILQLGSGTDGHLVGFGWAVPGAPRPESTFDWKLGRLRIGDTVTLRLDGGQTLSRPGNTVVRTPAQQLRQARAAFRRNSARWRLKIASLRRQLRAPVRPAPAQERAPATTRFRVWLDGRPLCVAASAGMVHLDVGLIAHPRRKAIRELSVGGRIDGWRVTWVWMKPIRRGAVVRFEVLPPGPTTRPQKRERVARPPRTHAELARALESLVRSLERATKDIAALKLEDFKAGR